MYQRFYGLRELPFELTPNPRFVYFSRRHREALSNLQYGLFSAKPVTVLIGEGRIDQAAKRLSELQRKLSVDEYDALRRRVAVGWMKAGDLVRADSAVSRDSSVEGLALSGRIRLYQGDLRGAAELFQAAGLRLEAWRSDADRLFALVIGSPA